MAQINNFAFSNLDVTEASEGFKNTSNFPDPSTENETRLQLQKLHSQVRKYINESIVPNINASDTHVSNTNNPHSVTKAQVGLGNVDNTSDLSKPISTATQTALNAKQANLVSGTNIKTINNQSILGSGNIQVDGTPQQYLKDASVSSNTLTITKKDNSTVTFTADEASWGNISGTLSNQTDLQTALNAKQNVLTAGTGISIVNNVISLSLSNANGQSF